MKWPDVGFGVSPTHLAIPSSRRCQGNAAEALPKYLAAARLERATRECGRGSAGPAEGPWVGAAPEHPQGYPGARLGTLKSSQKPLRDEAGSLGILGFSLLDSPLWLS